MIRANFKISKPAKNEDKKHVNTKMDKEKESAKDEWEEFMSKAGAAGSFMIYRSQKKEDELGLEEL